MDITKIKHIIFDMDGTLVDSAKISIAACRKIAPQFGLSPLPPATIAGAIGYANPDFYYQLYPNEKKQLLHAYGAAVERYEQEIMETFDEDFLFPHIRQMLQCLKEKNYTLYIASTGDVDHVTVSLTKGGIIHYFEKIFCNRVFIPEEPDAASTAHPQLDNGISESISPSPHDERICFCNANSKIQNIHTDKGDMVNTLLAGSDPSEWLMVGDKEKDASAASKNGVASLCFCFGYGTEEEQSLFDYSFDNPMELIAFLNGTCEMIFFK